MPASTYSEFTTHFFFKSNLPFREPRLSTKALWRKRKKNGWPAQWLRYRKRFLPYAATLSFHYSQVHKRGEGLGPAIAFLYSGPAINIMAIILTARILGIEMGAARTIGAVASSVIIGNAMSLIYRKED